MPISRGNMTKQLTGNRGMTKKPVKKMFMGGGAPISAGPPAGLAAGLMARSGAPGVVNRFAPPAVGTPGPMLGAMKPSMGMPMNTPTGMNVPGTSSSVMAPRPFKKGGKIDGAAMRGKTKGRSC